MSTDLVRSVKVPGTPLEVTVSDGCVALTGGLSAHLDGKCRVAVSAIESMVLAHAGAGVDVTGAAYAEGVAAAIDAVVDPVP